MQLLQKLHALTRTAYLLLYLQQHMLCFVRMTQFHLLHEQIVDLVTAGMIFLSLSLPAPSFSGRPQGHSRTGTKNDEDDPSPFSPTLLR